MTWLLTGGAGYIGAHVARALVDAGMPVVAYDDLSTGRREFLPGGVPLVVGSVLDAATLQDALRAHAVTGVVHLAAKKAAGESVSQPLRYYRENVEGTRVLLEQMVAAGVRRLVFSSSAAAYGTPDVALVTEDTPARPESPYGETKLVGEWLVRDVARVHPLAHTALRYFNVVGSGDPAVYDVSETNLFPLAFRALQAGRRPQVFGGDYPTPDGSAVRDYIHVADLADAHVAAARRLAEDGPVSALYNVGRGEGVSVREVLHTMAATLGVDLGYDVVDRRPGDPARIVASADRITAELGWRARRDLADMVRSGWAAWCRAARPGPAG